MKSTQFGRPVTTPRLFKLKGGTQVTDPQLNIVYDFVYGSVASKDFAKNAHGMAHLHHDGVVSHPIVKFSASLGSVIGVEAAPGPVQTV